jgi:TonB family protein
MFDARTDTPKHTSWMMGILAQLDKVLGPGAMDKPMITSPVDANGSAQPSDSPALQEIGTGKYDSLFPATTDKPSQIYLSTKNATSVPTVRVLKASPYQPIEAPLPEYPPIARVAGVEGDFTFTVDVQSDGRTTNFVVERGAPLFRAAVEKALQRWVFPKEAAGQQVVATLEFATNCSDKN